MSILVGLLTSLSLLAPGASCSWSAGASAAAGCQATGGKVVWVSPEGSDDAAGTRAAPLETIPAALGKAGDDGAAVQLLPGTYPAFLDSGDRTRRITVRGSGRATTIQGAKLYGSRGLSFENLRFGARVLVNQHGSLGPEQRAARLAFTGVEMTGGCLQALNVDGLRLTASWLHDCGVGVSAPRAERPSTRLLIAGNVIEELSGDGIMLGSAEGATIANNVIREMRRPAGSGVHNDGIQVAGGTRDTLIAGNVITGSEGQLLFVSDDFGTNDRLTVVNNLFHDAGSFAVQASGTTGLSFISNTIWDGQLGGLLLRRGRTLDRAARALVANNILSSYGTTSGATAVLRGNVVGNCRQRRAGLTCVRRPFRDAAAGDFTLARPGRMARLADRTFLPPVDLRLRDRGPAVPGALDARATATPRRPAGR